jgi:hypothetical protein
MVFATDPLPSSIRHINAFALADAGAVQRLVTLVLENLRLLRIERRLSISYKRAESQNIAIQLYECFDEAGFDVFDRHAAHDFGVVLMLAAVVGAISRLVGTGIDGRAAGWWP